MNEARISQIESRELTLEQHIGSPSRNVQKILAAGLRTGGSFRETEEAREQQAPAAPTLH